MHSFTAPDACILLVDDNEINREVVKAMLEPLEIEIDEARDGLEAVNMTKNRQYDLILMDSHMPVMSGEEATKAIREAETDTHIPVIALTADAISGVRKLNYQGAAGDGAVTVAMAVPDVPMCISATRAE